MLRAILLLIDKDSMVKRAAAHDGRSDSPLTPPEEPVIALTGEQGAGSSNLSANSPSDKSSPSKAKRRKKHTSKYKDEFQQVSNPKFVDVYRIPDMGYGGDVYYKADVRCLLTRPKMSRTDAWRSLYPHSRRMHGTTFCLL